MAIVGPHEDWEALGRRYMLSPEALRAANPQIGAPRAGDEIAIPLLGGSPSAHAGAAERAHADSRHHDPAAASDGHDFFTRLTPAPLTHRPVPGGITSGVSGSRYNPVLHKRMAHTGDDMHARMGESVGAAGDGVVVCARMVPGYGNLVVIYHGAGRASGYAHLSQISVRERQVLRAGQQVGEVGATGHATGPHLHFEVRDGLNPQIPGLKGNGAPLDPGRFLANMSAPRYLAATSSRGRQG
jgi:murein DD-endopeptidase MepM/ murein hydrolase activator NlpD